MAVSLWQSHLQGTYLQFLQQQKKVLLNEGGLNFSKNVCPEIFEKLLRIAPREPQSTKNVDF